MTGVYIGPFCCLCFGPFLTVIDMGVFEVHYTPHIIYHTSWPLVNFPLTNLLDDAHLHCTWDLQPWACATQQCSKQNTTQLSLFLASMFNS